MSARNARKNPGKRLLYLETLEARQLLNGIGVQESPVDSFCVSSILTDEVFVDLSLAGIQTLETAPESLAGCASSVTVSQDATEVAWVPANVTASLVEGAETSSLSIRWIGASDCKYEVGYIDARGTMHTTSRNLTTTSELVESMNFTVPDWGFENVELQFFNDSAGNNYVQKIGVTDTDFYTWDFSTENTIPEGFQTAGTAFLNGEVFDIYQKANEPVTYYTNEQVWISSEHADVSREELTPAVVQAGNCVIKNLKADSTYTAFVRTVASMETPASEVAESEPVTTWAKITRPVLVNACQTTESSLVLKVTNWNQIFPGPDASSEFVLTCTYRDSEGEPCEETIYFSYDSETDEWYSFEGWAAISIQNQKAYITLTGLNAFTTYKFTAQAFGEEAVSRSSFTTTIRTKKRETEAPANVNVELVSGKESSSASLTWEGLEGHKYSVGYYIGNSSVPIYLSFAVNVTESEYSEGVFEGNYTFKYLLSNKDYTFFVRANSTTTTKASELVKSETVHTFRRLATPVICSSSVQLTESSVSFRISNYASLVKKMKHDETIQVWVTCGDLRLVGTADSKGYVTIEDVELPVGQKYRIQAQIYGFAATEDGQNFVSALSNKVTKKVMANG